jgi:hypothetical protein
MAFDDATPRLETPAIPQKKKRNTPRDHDFVFLSMVSLI